jgi:hypothetical protein
MLDLRQATGMLPEVWHLQNMFAEFSYAGRDPRLEEI